MIHLIDGGKLMETGRTCIIGRAELPILKCSECGEEFDASDYEDIGPEPEREESP